MATNGELTVVERLTTLLDTGQFADVNVRVGKGNEQTVFKVSHIITYLWNSNYVVLLNNALSMNILGSCRNLLTREIPYTFKPSWVTDWSRRYGV